MPSAPAIDPRRTYVARINRVLDHIQSHLDGPLELQTRAAVAHFSPFHLHREFEALASKTLADRVRRLPLEAAAQRLLIQPSRLALSVALEMGFASYEVFTRAFKTHVGVPPTAWRRGAWRDFFEARKAHLSRIHEAQRKPRQAAAQCIGDDLFTGHPRPQPHRKESTCKSN